MLFVYVNYPNPRISVHSDPACGHVYHHQKDDNRIVKLNITSLSTELSHFVANDYLFSATAELNDMWLEIDCQDQILELAIVGFVRTQLAKHYKPFNGIEGSFCNCMG